MINDKDRTNKVKQLVSDIDSMTQTRDEINNAIDAAEDELRDELYIETADQEDIQE